MIIIPDKKKMATAIIADLHSEPEESSADDGDSFEALASQIMSAVKSGSAKDLADGLKAFFMECESKEDDGGYE